MESSGRVYKKPRRESSLRDQSSPVFYFTLFQQYHIYKSKFSELKENISPADIAAPALGLSRSL